MEKEERNDLFDEECFKAIERKNLARNKILANNTRQRQEKYKCARKESKGLFRKKKRANMHKKLLSIESARLTQETRKFYENIREAKRQYQPLYTGIRDKGNLIMEKDKAIQRWTEYFEETFRAVS